MTFAPGVGRPPRDPSEISGNQSVKAQSLFAATMHIDWSNHIGSDIWTRQYPPREALQQVIDSGRAEKLAGSHVRDWIVPHSVDSLQKALGGCMSKHGKRDIGPEPPGSVKNLYHHGHLAISKDYREALKYDWRKLCKQIQEEKVWPNESSPDLQGRAEEIVEQTSPSFRTAASESRQSLYPNPDTISFAARLSVSPQPGVASNPRKRKAVDCQLDSGTRSIRTEARSDRTVVAHRHHVEKSIDRQIHKSVQTARHRDHSPPCLQSDETLPDRTRFYLDNDALASRLQKIFISIANHVRSELAVQSIDVVGPAQRSLHPSSALNAAYASLTGVSDHGQQEEPISAHALDTEEFVVALVGISVQQMVFEGRDVSALLFARYHDTTRSALGPLWSANDRYLGRLSTDMDTVLREGYLTWISDRNHPDLAQVANMITGKIIDLVQAHFYTGEGPFADGVIAKRWWNSLSDLVSNAVQFRCQVSCARERYDFRWPERWQSFNAGWMETRDQTGGRAVIAAFSPALVLERNACSEILSKAMVRAL